MLQKFRGYIMIICLFLALAAGLATARVMVAQTGEADLSGSTVTVDRSTVVAGDSLQYSVVIRNSGGTAVTGVVMTNTLPAEVTYQTGSLATSEVNATTIASSDTGNIITWEGDIEPQGSVTLSYAVDVADTVAVGDAIENIVQISGMDETIERAASTLGTASYFQVLPLVFRPVPAPVLNTISGPTASGNNWTLTWSKPITNATAYQVQEANSINFSSPVTYDLGDVATKSFAYSASFNNKYCYRVRTIFGTQYSDWSNVECTVGYYLDEMSNASSGWAIRQEDTDDSDNYTYYQNGEYVVKIGGRWDYAVASPLVEAPKPPYAIESRIAFDPTVDNLHAYGIVFGGNWNGLACPNSSYSSCFTHYYRVLVIWYGPLNSFRIELKRIDGVDPVNNAGRGVTLDGFKDVHVGNSKGFNVWRVEVGENGLIRVLLNGSQVLSAVDNTYINDPYFGVLAASNEYLGAEPHVDWYSVVKR